MKRQRSRRGYTLVEITVVLIILVIFATLITPNMMNIRKGEDRRTAYNYVLHTAELARESAIDTGTTYAIAYDASGNGVRLVRQPPPDPNTSSSNNNIPDPAARPLQNINTVSDMQEVQTQQLPGAITASAFRIGQTNSDSGSWLIHFYPDGTSDGGALELTEGKFQKSLTVDQNGFAKIVDGQLPDPTTQSWPAGTYAQTTTTSTTP